MADLGAHKIRKDFKFEIFLKRNLEPEEYERVRFYDFCVITSRKEKCAYKYVVLTDEWIYLTESPPKSVSREVQLRDVIGIEWIRDFPDFLMDGNLKQNVQHICVKYLYSNGSRSRRDRLSPINAGDGLSTTRSFRSDFNSTESTVGLASARSVSRPSGVVPPLKLNDDGEDVEKDVRIVEPTVTVDETNETKVSACHCLPCCRPPAVPKLTLNDEAAIEETEVMDDEEEKTVTHRENGVIGPDTQRSLRLKLDDLPTSSPHSKSFRESTFRSSRRSTRGRSEPAVGQFHIYLLNSETPILLLFRSAWNTCMLRGTRLMDEEYEKRCTPRGKPLPDESVAFLFARLKNELFESASYLDASFELTNELMNATERNFAIKKLFWRSPDLFRFLVRRLKMYIPRSKVKFNTPEGRIQRTDELDYCVLVVDTLKLMLQETETIPARNNCLRSRGGEEFLELVDVLTGEVVMPDEYQPLSNAAAKLLNQTALEMELRKVDRELDQLMDELTTSGAAILYEMLVTGRNASDGPSDSLPSESKIVKRIELSEGSEEYVRRLVEHTLSLIVPTNQKSLLKPMQAVEVFQQFSILRSLVFFSRKIKEMLQENYMEEFKYFVQAPVVLQKLSHQYLITRPALGVIEEVTGIITGKANLSLLDDEELSED